MHEINEKRERLGEYHRLCVELQSHEDLFFKILSYVLLIVVKIISVTKITIQLFFLLYFIPTTNLS
jgi:hypothetical protein